MTTVILEGTQSFDVSTKRTCVSWAYFFQLLSFHFYVFSLITGVLMNVADRNDDRFSILSFISFKEVWVIFFLYF